MGFERKKEIYAICVEFDIMSVPMKMPIFMAHNLCSIVEDDPYYFLQQGPYVPKTDRVEEQIEVSVDSEAYIANLVPSFLKYAGHHFPFGAI
jgi:aromatic amino acid aminotransferase I